MNSLARDQSEFNMAVSYLDLLVDSLWAIKEYRRRYDAKGWFDELVILFDNLMMDEKSIGDWASKMDELNQKIASSEPGEIPPKLFLELRHFQRFLINTLKDSGLLTKLKEEMDETPQYWDDNDD